MAKAQARKKAPGKKAAARRAPAREPAAKLDRILAAQEQILKREQAIQRDEHRIERLEEKEVALEQQSLAGERAAAAQTRKEESELEKLERLENDIKKEVAPHPLTRITTKDFAKGIVGAFVGVVVHFTFTYGVELADNISVARASFLLLFTLLIGAAFLYATGFRKIDDKSVYWLMPWRIIVLYSTAVIVTIATLWFFYPHFLAEPTLAFKRIATVNLSAVIGACTADLIGRD